MTTDLRFADPRDGAQPVELRFGASDPAEGPAHVAFAITLGLQVAIEARNFQVERATIGITLGTPILTAAAHYDNAVPRGPGLNVRATWQGGATADVAVPAGWQRTTHRPAATVLPVIDAQTAPAQASVGWRSAETTRIARATPWNAGTRAGSVAATAWDEATRTRLASAARFEEARPADAAPIRAPHRETIRTSRPVVQLAHEEGRPVDRQFSTTAHDAAGLVRSWVVPWHEGRAAPVGSSVVTPTPPAPHHCYTPPPGREVALVFVTSWTPDTTLTFICDNHPPAPSATVVVPIQEVYMVSNEVSLVLAADGTTVPASSFSLSLDYRSWAWSFSARVPRSALALFGMDAGGDAMVLTATVNATAFGVIAESVSSDRSFESGEVTVNGRGLIAGLAKPYAPTLTFANATQRTAQQLAVDALTTNGVSLDWAIDWQLADWPVPAGAWSLQGTYMDALQAIAAAAGGYVQPTANDQTVRILPLFPAAPWNWSTLQADYQLPSSVAVHEGIAWADQPAYNRIFVSGANDSGVLGQITRAGTAGDLEKPMVTDPLITHADAARQRGIAELGVGGRSAVVSLKTPVLPATGIIVPGKIVDYVDAGTTRRGIVRSVTVDVAFPAVYQTLGIETYV